jgi:hypothetical protein
MKTKYQVKLIFHVEAENGDEAEDKTLIRLVQAPESAELVDIISTPFQPDHKPKS